MAKSKNHTAHNDNFKNHKNGIKKPNKNDFRRLVGCNQKWRKNRRVAIQHDKNHPMNKGNTKS